MKFVVTKTKGDDKRIVHSSKVTKKLYLQYKQERKHKKINEIKNNRAMTKIKHFYIVSNYFMIQSKSYIIHDGSCFFKNASLSKLQLVVPKW